MSIPRTGTRLLATNGTAQGSPVASPTVQMNVRLEPSLYARLNAAIAASGLTTTAFVAQALEAFLNTNKQRGEG